MISIPYLSRRQQLSTLLVLNTRSICCVSLHDSQQESLSGCVGRVVQTGEFAGCSSDESNLQAPELVKYIIRHIDKTYPANNCKQVISLEGQMLMFTSEKSKTDGYSGQAKHRAENSQKAVFRLSRHDDELVQRCTRL